MALLGACASPGSASPVDGGGADAAPNADASGPTADAASSSGSSSSSSSSSSGGSSSSGSGSSSGGSSSGGTEAGAPDATVDSGPSLSALGFACPPGPFGSPVPAGAKLTRVAGVPPPDPEGGIDMMGFGFSTIEGPVWLDGALYVSEFPGNPNPPPSRILRVDSSGNVSVAGPAGWNPGSNGLAIDHSGVLYAAVHADGSISRIDLATGTRTPIATGYPSGGPRFNSPNDLTIRSDGTIYFSDPNYQAPTGGSGFPQGNVTGLYRIAPGTHAVTLADGTLQQPNGVTLSVDERTLYVSSKTMNGVVTQYPVMDDGTLGAGTVFAQTLALPGGSVPAALDGMTTDCAGNLYGAVITSGSNASVVVLSPTGALLANLPVPNASSATNVAFGGADHKTLYVTAQGSDAGQNGSSAQGLYTVALNVPGMPF